MAAEREIQLLIKAKDEAGGVLSGHMKQLDDLTQKYLGLSLKVVAAYAAVAAAVVTAVKATYEFTEQMAKAGDVIEKMSARTAISAEELSKWGYVLELNGASLQEFEGATKRLSRAMYDAQRGTKEQVEAFQKLGVSITDGSGQLIDINEAMLQVSDGMKRLSSDTERTALMQVLLGRGGGNLAVAMYQGRDAITAQMTELERLGGVMSGEFADSSAGLVDSHTRLKAAWNGLKMAMAEPLMEPLADMTNAAARATAALNDNLERQLRLRITLASIPGLGFLAGGGASSASTGMLPGQAALNYGGMSVLPGVSSANDLNAMMAAVTPGNWSSIGGPSSLDVDDQLLDSMTSVDDVLKEAATHSHVLKDELNMVGETGNYVGMQIASAMGGALEQAIMQAKDLDDIISSMGNALVGALVHLGVSAAVTAIAGPGAGVAAGAAMASGGSVPRAAYGMTVRGGIPGIDSVPVLAQAGEEIIDRSLSMELRSFLAASMYGGGGASVRGAATVAPVSVVQQFAFPVRESDRRAIGRHTRRAVNEAQGGVL